MSLNTTKRVLAADFMKRIGFARNYISNNIAFDTSNDWVGYADAGGVRPVDGTGGSSNLNFSLSTSAATIRSELSFRLSRSAAVNAQGSGRAIPFTLDKTDQGKIIRLSFDYAVATGAFSYGNGTIASPSDFTVWLYDITNAQLLEPVNPFLDGSGKYISEVQMPGNSTSYRFIIHCSTTTNTALDFDFDNVFVGPREISRGAVVEDSIDMSSPLPTTAGFGTISNVSIRRRRVGDMLLIYGNFSTGTVAATTASFSLPTGMVIDSTKLPSSGAGTIVGSGNTVTTGSTAISKSAFEYDIFYDGSDTAKLYFAQSTNGSTLVKANGSNVANSSMQTSFSFMVPIAGWSSNASFSGDFGGRVIAATYTAANAINSSTTQPINFANRDFDKTFAVTTGAAWKFTAQEPGDYFVSCGHFANASYNVDLYKNGTLFRRMFAGSTDGVESGSIIVELASGDFIDIRTDSSQNTSGTTSYVSIMKISSPQSLMGSESIFARYTSTAGQSIANSGDVRIDFATKDQDSHAAVTTGASWSFLVPRAGRYRVMSKGSFSSNTYGINDTINFKIYKNGSQFSVGPTVSAQTTSNIALGTLITDTLTCVAGDTIDIRVSNSRTAGASNLVSAAGFVTVDIQLVK